MGTILELPIFDVCNCTLMYFIIWVSYIACSTLGIFVCSAFKNPNGNAAFIAITLFCGAVLSLCTGIMYKEMYSFSSVINVFWGLIIPFGMGRIFGGIAVTEESIDYETKYTWVNITQKEEGYNKIIIPSVGSTIGFIVLDFFLAALFAYYFDVVWPGEFGIPKSKLFFLHPSYWTNKTKERDEPIIDVSKYDANNLASVKESTDPDIAREIKETIAKSERKNDNTGVTILNLSKTFRTGKRSSAQDCRALDMFTGYCENNSVFSLLGHNGAGKTTAINILTGVISPSYGDAFIMGKSIITSMDEIQDSIGVCPQEDIIWPGLTGREHMRIFCMLKGIPRSEAELEIITKASKVGLLKYLDRKAEKYSGGMKRRLSVAIAMIGNPKVIFLDEPTSGLDPA